MLSHPYRWIPDQLHRIVFGVAFVLTGGLMLALQLIDRPLRTGVAPNGIVSFELAGTLKQATDILNSWSPAAKVYAGLSLGLDYLFMPAYAIFIGMGCVLATCVFKPASFVARLGNVLAWALLVAAVLDATENFALIRLLLHGPAPLWPAVANVCARLKFFLVGCGLLYGAVGLVIWVVRKLR